MYACIVISFRILDKILHTQGHLLTRVLDFRHSAVLQGQDQRSYIAQIEMSEALPSHRKRKLDVGVSRSVFSLPACTQVSYAISPLIPARSIVEFGIKLVKSGSYQLFQGHHARSAGMVKSPLGQVFTIVVFVTTESKLEEVGHFTASLHCGSAICFE
jgi:hypothetical protein